MISPMISFMHRERLFAGVALIGAGISLSSDAMRDFYSQIADMYIDNNKRKSVRGEGFEGLIQSDGRFCHIGGIGGINYKGELDIEGRDTPLRLSYMIVEKINAENN